MPERDPKEPSAEAALPWYARRRWVGAFLMICAALVTWDLTNGEPPRGELANASQETVDVAGSPERSGRFNLSPEEVVDAPLIIEPGRTPVGTTQVQIAIDGSVVAQGYSWDTAWVLDPMNVIPGGHAVSVTALNAQGDVLASGARRYDLHRQGPSSAVSGNKIVDEEGRPLRLVGVNRPGLEFACSQGWGLTDGPMDDEGIDRLVSFGGNVVRLPVNAKCWLSSRDVKEGLKGSIYQQTVKEAVDRITDRGLRVIIDLHWSSPTGKQSGQEVMADAEHAIPFWKSAGEAFRDNPSVLFDLYNEPVGISWQCWRDGCTTDEGWRAAGMQELVDALRSTGARQPILVGGNDWANDLSRWREFRPQDPVGQMIASVHIYPTLKCVTRACWEGTITPVAQEVPVLIGEFGSKDCRPDYANQVMDYADDHGLNWTAWAWHPGDCSDFPSLIESWEGEPSPWGVAVKERLAQLS